MDWAKYPIVFLTGGGLCVIAQLLISLTKLAPARILVLYVTAGAILTGLGVYKPLIDFAGAGASVPLTGFGYALATGAIEGARQSGVLGAFTGGIKATAGGVARPYCSATSMRCYFGQRQKNKQWGCRYCGSPMIAMQTSWRKCSHLFRRC